MMESKSCIQWTSAAWDRLVRVENINSYVNDQYTQRHRCQYVFEGVIKPVDDSAVPRYEAVARGSESLGAPQGDLYQFTRRCSAVSM